MYKTTEHKQEFLNLLKNKKNNETTTKLKGTIRRRKTEEPLT